MQDGVLSDPHPIKSFIMKVVDNKLEWQINSISYFEALGWLDVMRSEIIKKIESENSSKN